MREAYAEERKTLFVVGSYHIGKERAFLGAAKALDFKIWCHQAKKKVQGTALAYAAVLLWLHATVGPFDTERCVPACAETCSSRPLILICCYD